MNWFEELPVGALFRITNGRGPMNLVLFRKTSDAYDRYNAEAANHPPGRTKVAFGRATPIREEHVSEHLH